MDDQQKIAADMIHLIREQTEAIRTLTEGLRVQQEFAAVTWRLLSELITSLKSSSPGAIDQLRSNLLQLTDSSRDEDEIQVLTRCLGVIGPAR